jgi:hypothetical protein
MFPRTHSVPILWGTKEQRVSELGSEWEGSWEQPAMTM